MQATMRVGILTGGGDCPGLNAVIRAVAKSLIKSAGAEVIGIEQGFLGLIERRVRPLDLRSSPAVERHHLVKVAVIFEMSVGWTRVGSLGKSIGV